MAYVLCKRCKKREHQDEDEFGPIFQCGTCDDRDIQHSNERAEWHHYHSED